MRKDFEKAKKLRKSGLSYSKIHEILGVPVSTLSDWFSKFEWSKDVLLKNNQKALAQTLKNLNEVHKTRRDLLNNHYKQARIDAVREFELLKNETLFIMGLSLYWGEGDKKTTHHVRITNSDPAIIKIFKLFLVKYFSDLNQVRIRGNIFLYPDLDKKTCIEFWSKKIPLPIEQFTKSTHLQGRSTNRLQFGTCTLIVSSRFHKEKMLEWLRLLEKEYDADIV